MMDYADTARVEAHIADILNASGSVWGGAIISGIRGKSIDSIRTARKESGWEILRAIGSNPQNGHFGPLATPVNVNHNAMLPDYDGEPGIPLIVPFSGADPQEGIPADPDEIDSYRNAAGLVLYTGALDGLTVAHDQADALGLPSPLSLRYSIVNGRFKFTGYSAQIPLIQITEEMADTKIPMSYESTLVKLSIPKLVKEGDNLALISERYRAMGQEDLLEIMGGAMKVRPVPNIVTGQKQVI